MIVVLLMAVAVYGQNNPAPVPTTSAPTAPEAAAPGTTSSDSTKLEPIKIVKAIYPEAAKAEKLEGRVIVKAVISETGDVDSVEVVSGNALLAQAAVDAVKQWKYKPYVKGGKLVRVSTNLACDFVVPAESPEPASTEADANRTPVEPSKLGTSASPNAPDSTALVLLTKEEVKYPGLAMLQGIQGQVVVRVVIAESGDVDAVDLVSGDSMLATATQKSVRKWKFQPFIRNGRPVKTSTLLSFNFAFKDKVVDYKEYTPPIPSDSATTSAPGSASKAPSPGSPAQPVGAAAPQRVRVSQAVSRGMLIHKVQPVYPPEAKTERIQGIVVLQATISRQGTIKNLHVISGPHELADAAVGAVEQWRYRPYTLNGEPVEVETTIEVRFTFF